MSAKPPIDLGEAVSEMRQSLRRHAELFSRIATIAADNGDLQRGLRMLAQATERYADGLDVTTIDASDYDVRRDTVALGLLNMTVAAGAHNYGAVARDIKASLDNPNKIGD